MRVADTNENQLITTFRELLPSGERTLIGSGDDCAQIVTPEGHFIVTTDVLVEGRHFRVDWSSAYEIGARAAAQNLADIAAMGGRASALVVSLVLPADTEVDWLNDLVEGCGDRAREAGAGVVGGDLSSGDQLVIAVTAMGWCPHGVVVRSGAQPGDVLAVAGTLGRSAAGLAALSSGKVPPCTPSAELPSSIREAVSVFRAPVPPLEAGVHAALAGVHAMMDVSDGLAVDARRMAKASGVVIEVDPALLKEDVDALLPVVRLVNPEDSGAEEGYARSWVVGGGEDHSLLAAFPHEAPLPEGFRPIGCVRACRGGESPAALMNGQKLTGGWDHFACDTIDGRACNHRREGER